MPISRREFISLLPAGIVATHAACNAHSLLADESEQVRDRLTGLTGRRFLTINTVVRVNQIEVTRTKNAGADERDRHTPETVQQFREAVEKGWPGARITWALSWRALFDTSDAYGKIRDILVKYHVTYGDEITFIPGAYFANAYNTRKQVNLDLHDGLARVGEIVGGRYRPKSVLAGFLAAANQKYLAVEEGIHVCQGNIWSQYAIDNQDGDGSVSYPYYPSAEHFCKPAQSKKDFIDCVNLDGWTMDFLAARREGFAGGFNSRMGVGPIETVKAFGPETGLRQIMQTTALHFDSGFILNNFAWVTNCWEISLVKEFGHLEVLTRWLQQIRARWPGTNLITQGDFGLLWRTRFGNNDTIDYRFVQRGTGIGGSDRNLEIDWYMNKSFRLAILRDWENNGPKQVIDFTRYDLPAQEPQSLTRSWSLLGEINQKGKRPQDRPVLFSSLPDEDKSLIYKRIPDIDNGLWNRIK